MTVKEEFVNNINVMAARCRQAKLSLEEHQEWLAASANLQGLLDTAFPEEPVEVKEEK